MRGALPLLLVLCVAGCLVKETTLVPEQVVPLAANQTRTWPLPGGGDQLSARVRVTPGPSDGVVAACVPLGSFRTPGFDPAFSLLDGCAYLQPGKPYEQTFDERGARTLFLHCAAGGPPCSPTLSIAQVDATGQRNAGVATLVVAAIALAVGIRVLMDRSDRAAIREFAARHGYEVEEIRWSPFGPGRERAYEVDVRGPRGTRRTVRMRTSALGGTWTDAGLPAED